MGLGLGIISQPVMSPEGDLTLFPTEEAQSGADASVGRIGLAGVVAVIGGNSTFVDDVPDTDETESET